MSAGREGDKGGAANVKGRSNVNDLYALQSEEKTRDRGLPAPLSRQITTKFSDESLNFGV